MVRLRERILYTAYKHRYFYHDRGGVFLDIDNRRVHCEKMLINDVDNFRKKHENPQSIFLMWSIDPIN